MMAGPLSGTWAARLVPPKPCPQAGVCRSLPFLGGRPCGLRASALGHYAEMTPSLDENI